MKSLIEKEREKDFPWKCSNLFYRSLMAQAMYPFKEVTTERSGKVTTHKGCV